MTIGDLAKKPGEWLRGVGNMSDIVISSRIRLARNVANYPFLSKATEQQRQELSQMLRRELTHLAPGESPGAGSSRGESPGARSTSPWQYLDMGGLDELDHQVLVERHLVSKQLVDAKGSRGVALSPDEVVSVMVNEEDHLRIQVLRSGLDLDSIWRQINDIDDHLECGVNYAFHPRYGYLTACPTNVGTGIRVSVMLHLPALKLTGEIEKVFRSAKDMRLAVRGLFGEGTEATGDFFQISNQVTLGKTEEDILNEFKSSVIPKIIEYEQRARKALVMERTLALDDRIYRSYGILRHARTISSEETMLHLSHLRMGVHLGRLKNVNLAAINELFLLTQPAHLQKIHGARLSGDQRSSVRAELIRRKLGGD